MTDGCFDIHVAGVTFDNENGTSRQVIIRLCKVGDPLILKHVPVDQDANAVQVLRENGDQVGYLPREIATEIAPILDRGESVDAKIVEKTKFAGTDGKMKWGCRIQVTTPEYKEFAAKKTRKTAIGCAIIVLAIIVVFIIIGLIVC